MKFNNQQRNNQNNQSGEEGGNPQRRPFNWFLIALLGLIAIQVAYTFTRPQAEEISWTKFKREMLSEQEVDRITVVNKERAEVYIKEDLLGKNEHSDIKASQPGPHYVFNIGSVENFAQTVENAQKDLASSEKIDVSYTQRRDWTGTILSWVLPLLIIIGIWMLILRGIRRGAGGGFGGKSLFDFGKSNAKQFEKGQSDVKFDDIAGLEEVKTEVHEIVDFLKNSERYTKLGAKIPKGVLLIGPPGTGKTLLAKAVAGEAEVPFFSISGSEFVEMFVGVGASRVRDLFKKAKQNAPSIVFIDEVDAIGQSRGKAASIQSNDEKENTLNQMLSEMDGFGPNTGVIVLAATNRGEVLDRALLRPGRFDRQIYLQLPTRSERLEIFKVHTKPLKLADDVDIEVLSGQTPGFSGADIANICNEAALVAARHKKEAVEMKDFMEAADRIIAGLQKKGKIISDEEKEVVAHHEAGHATASWYLKHADNLLKVSIVPRGRSLGAAWYLPEENVIYTKEQLLDRLCASLAGRAAEDIIFGRVSSGALDDLEKVTKQAYTMVAYYGLNESLGNISYYDSTGQQGMFQKPYSEATAQKIDEDVQNMVSDAYERTKKILSEHEEELRKLAKTLLEKEVVLKKDLDGIFKEPPAREEDENVTSAFNENGQGNS